MDTCAAPLGGPAATIGAAGPVAAVAATPDMGDEKKLSIIERLMLRGARGELIQQPWFQSIRRDNADMFVYVSFGVALLTVLVLQFAVSSITMARFL